MRVRDPMERRITHSSPQQADLSRSRELPPMGVSSHVFGALALGAIAVGALAIGALAIGRLAVGRARIRRLEIDQLVVRQLRVTEELDVPPKPNPES